MRQNKVTIIKGKNLPNKKAREINKIFQKEFPGNEPVDPKKPKLFSDDTFFIVDDSKNKILSVGRLRPVKIKFLEKTYKIQGIADIVSVIKKKGHGKAVMQKMLKYLNSKKQIGIGFCSRKNSLFYQKSGFRIAKNLIKRFWYKSPKGRMIKGGKGNVLYSANGKKLIKKILSKPKEMVLIPCKPW